MPTYDFDDETISRRLEDRHIKRLHAKTNYFDDNFKNMVDNRVDTIVSHCTAQLNIETCPEDKDITLQEVTSSIDSMNLDSCPGPDGITPSMIKYGGPLLISHLYTITSLLYKNGYFSSIWKLDNKIYKKAR